MCAHSKNRWVEKKRVMKEAIEKYRTSKSEMPNLKKKSSLNILRWIFLELHIPSYRRKWKLKPMPWNQLNNSCPRPTTVLTSWREG